MWNSLSVLDERTALIYYLDAQRGSALAIVDGLAQEHDDVSVVPSGWTVASMFEHLAGAERFWFQHVLAGQADVSEPSGTDPRSRYRKQITRSDLIVESFALDARRVADSSRARSQPRRSAQSLPGLVATKLIDQVVWVS